MELHTLVARIADAERVQTEQWCRLIDLADVSDTEVDRFLRGELDLRSWQAVSRAVLDAMTDAFNQWRDAREMAAEYAREMDRLVAS